MFEIVTVDEATEQQKAFARKLCEKLGISADFTNWMTKQQAIVIINYLIYATSSAKYGVVVEYIPQEKRLKVTTYPKTLA